MTKKAKPKPKPTLAWAIKYDDGSIEASTSWTADLALAHCSRNPGSKPVRVEMRKVEK